MRAPYGTSFSSVAARPAATPLVVPIKPPNIIAELGLFKPINFAAKGVKIEVIITLTTPVATLKAIISELAPKAEPVTGPTI